MVKTEEKMRISDYVASYLLELLSKENGEIEIQRNELANSLGCVPSQINYVLSSRFTPEQGYIVESHRGEGGYIRIIRRFVLSSDVIMHLVNSIGDEIDYESIYMIVSNLTAENVIDNKISHLILAATSNQTLSRVSNDQKDITRASIFKNMLLAAVDKE
jgi:transcriptional regulator CtsR